MAKKRKGGRPIQPALKPTQLALPGGLALVGVVLMALGHAGIGAGLLMGAIAALLYVVGKSWRWKGAPEAAYIFAGVGVIIILLALFN